MKRPLTWIVCLVCQVAVARGEYFQGPYGAGGSWNVYEFVAEPTDWRSAAAAASERSYGSVAGQLVDILSAQENSLIEWIGNGEPVWIGLTDREGAAPATISGGLPAPQESRTLPDRTAQGWAWTSGSLFQYQNWDVDEPRDYRGAEDAAHLLRNGRWNDIGSGYRADEPAPPLLQPNTSSDELSAFRAPFVIEYALQSASPVPGVLVPTIPAKMPPQLPGAPGGAGTLRVTDYRGDFQVGKRIEDVASLVTAIATGAEIAESWSALYPRADVADPDGRSGGGPTVDGAPYPFPSQIPQQVDQNFVSVAHGTIHVPEAGLYTIQVQSSSGFALQIGDAQFTGVGGSGQIDANDARTLYHTDATGNSGTWGVVPLAAGEHELRFLHWATTGPAYWELTSALGAHAQAATAQWLAIGDGRTLESRTVTPSVRLVGPATVANVRDEEGGRSGNLEVARELLTDALANGTTLLRNDVTTIVLGDEDGICCHRPGRNLEPENVFLWPINDPAWGGHDEFEDHFSSAIFGQFTVDDGDPIRDETLPVTFGLFSSDGAQLHIHGVDFQDANDVADLTFWVEGDRTLSFPDATSNSNSLGLAELTEGRVYDFDAVHFDNLGDAGFELWAAIGNHLDGFDARLFSPVSSEVEGWTIPRNVGLTWVEPPIRRAGDANLDGRFDSTDLVDVMGAGKYEASLPASWAEGDWDGDGYFSTADLVIALQDGGYNAGPLTTTVAVPEPASDIGLLVLSALLQGIFNRRRSSGVPAAAARKVSRRRIETTDDLLQVVR